MSDNTFYGFIFLSITTMFLGLTVSCSHYGLTTTKFYTENGYCEKELVGSHRTIWIKCEGALKCH